MKLSSLNFLATLLMLIFVSGCSDSNSIKLGVTPYQDTALPILTESLGYYEELERDIDLIHMSWGDVMTNLAAGNIDLSIQNLSTFQQKINNVNVGNEQLIFIYPLFVFKGNAIMVRAEDGFKTMEGLPNDSLHNVIMQLKGKTVIAENGTEMEQIVIEALDFAGLEQKVDVDIRHIGTQKGVNAFLGGEGDAYSGGLPERTYAKSRGAVVLLDASHISTPVINGFVTRASFYRENKKDVDEIVESWFRTIRWVNQNKEEGAEIMVNYLASVASVKYTVEEYIYAWNNLDLFFDSKESISENVLNENSPFYIYQNWEDINSFLLKEEEIEKPASIKSLQIINY